VPSRGRKSFSLITQPEPLPDTDTPAAAEAAVEVQPSPPLRQEASPARAAKAPKQPTAQPPVVAAPAPAPAAAESPSTRAATTIRLRPSAAEPLNAAWLNERRYKDPKISYPEFASRVVALGLAAYEEQQTS
jgi:hypothetical protein